jgi:hypothetical protein
MTIELARAMLSTVAEHGEPALREFAHKVLFAWDSKPSVSDAAVRMRESRARRKTDRAGPVAESDAQRAQHVATMSVTRAQPNEQPLRNGSHVAPLVLSLSLKDSEILDLKERESGVHSVAPALHAVAVARKKHRFPESVPPDPTDTSAFASWCLLWSFDASDKDVRAMANHNYGKGIAWRDWKAALRNWKSREFPSRPAAERPSGPVPVDPIRARRARRETDAELAAIEERARKDAAGE